MMQSSDSELGLKLPVKELFQDCSRTNLHVWPNVSVELPGGDVNDCKHSPRV